ncbi:MULTISPECIES: hypothetical protein [unclassified Neglectibacter]|nr:MULTISPECIES: hypothetical protein [unclassified Neglectibacter]
MEAKILQSRKMGLQNFFARFRPKNGLHGTNLPIAQIYLLGAFKDTQETF